MKTESRLKPNPTQCQKVLKVLLEANGEWVNGRYFLHTLYLSQYHTRIFELQKQGYEIESSDFTDDYGFKSYRILQEAEQLSLV